MYIGDFITNDCCSFLVCVSFFFSTRENVLNGPFGYLWAFVDGRKLVARRPQPGLTLESFSSFPSSFFSIENILCVASVYKLQAELLAPL